MPGAAFELNLKGSKELEKAFKKLRDDVLKELRPEIRKLAKPVAVDAQRRALVEISNIGGPWSKMRLGVLRSGVYVTPSRRGLKGSAPAKRPNLVGLLLDRAMEPALGAHQDEILKGFDELVNRNSKQQGFF